MNQVQNRSAFAHINTYMGSVHRYREEINRLQAAWDNLSLLGQLSGTGTDMTETRLAFSNLTNAVLEELSSETLLKLVAGLSAKAQVIIDILVRNLFERTADVGFISTDEDVRQFLLQTRHEGVDEQALFKLRMRFKEYAQKYSVYSNIILLDPQGKVLVQLDEDNPVGYSTDPLIAEAKNTSMPYVEVFRKSDLLPNQGESLIYAYRVTSHNDSAVLGVLCLCFRFENEMQGVFANLIAPDSWLVGLMLDQNHRVIASSDPYHVPLHARLEVAAEGKDWLLTRFAGREYICVSKKTHGYQGYMGPDWMGHVMVPLQHAFSQDIQAIANSIDSELLSKVMRSPLLFSKNLLEIPKQAALIQNKLNQSVWNGSIWQSRSLENKNNKFSKLLLGEMSNTGLKTQNIVEKSVSELYQTVVAGMLENSSFHAALSVDIMDRNLYERANDCRWWALTTVFKTVLSQPQTSNEDSAQVANILRYINSLYTVYENLVVFDRNGKVIAVSNPNYEHLCGTFIEEDWARATKTCNNSQEYVVSRFEPSIFSGGKPSYIYATCIRSDDGFGIVGGIGAVFDSEKQFASMLGDALPHGVDGAPIKGSFTLFVDGELKIISSTIESQKVGDSFTIHPDICELEPGQTGFDIAIYEGLYYAVGACASSGYREYKSETDSYRNQIVGLIFIPLGSIEEIHALIASDNALQKNQFKPSDSAASALTQEYASLYIENSWFGLPASEVVEAVEAIHIRPIPDSPQQLAGIVQYGSEFLPVVNAAYLLGYPKSDLHYGQQIIVIEAEGNRPRFGLLVASLGEIPPIDRAQIESISKIFPDSNSKLIDGVVRLSSVSNPNEMLIVLSVEGIFEQVKLPNFDPLSFAPIRKVELSPN